MKVSLGLNLFHVLINVTVELGVVIGKAGSNIKEENAFKHVAGYALALDLTARDLQVILY
jgi:acylpyruvate hydrolase